MTSKKIKNKLKEYNLNLTKIAEMFQYNTLQSFQGSSAYKKRLESIIELIEHIEEIKKHTP
jgi:anaerobic ribonucleoside-triphosphate reductase